MVLDPKVKTFLDQQAAAGSPPRYTLPIEVARQQARQAAKLAGPLETVASVKDRVITGPGGDLTLKIITPEGTGPFPALVYFHGGGWVLGSIETHEPMARSFAKKAGCVVVSVDYRLAPENKFPAAFEDCYAAVEWLALNASEVQVDAAKIAVGGDSAGGNLAAAVCLQARETKLPLVFQLLIYPILGYYSPGTGSYRENARGFGLSQKEMAWFFDSYLSHPGEARNYLVCPLESPDLRGLPPALIIVAEYDPLRDEGRLYTERLKEAGVQAKFKEYKGMIHNFMRMGTLFEQAQEALDWVGEELRKVFAFPQPASTAKVKSD